MADLLREAASPNPRFAVVVCEDIERSARDTFNSLKLEKELGRNGIPLFATDEPTDIAGVNSTTLLVRRVKQGVAEWYRLKLKEQTWKGFAEHNAEGWNIGPAPYGYMAEKHAHPNPVKAAQGRTKTRLVINPGERPAVEAIFRWRTVKKLGVPTITNRLNDDPEGYPSPGGKGWTDPAVRAILANPKYTGHQVYGRRTKRNGHVVPATPEAWLWTPEPAHEATITMDTWKAAQERSGPSTQPAATTAPPAPAAPGRPTSTEAAYAAATAPSACAAAPSRPTSTTPARTRQPTPATPPPTPATRAPCRYQRRCSIRSPGGSSKSGSSAPAVRPCSPPSFPPLTPKRKPAATRTPPPFKPKSASSAQPRR
jgi:DNA invertase Pin-like site-specific DNA recombinase